MRIVSQRGILLSSRGDTPLETTPWKQSQLYTLIRESGITVKQVAELVHLPVATIYNAGRQHPIKMRTHLKLFMGINALRNQKGLPPVKSLPVQVEANSSDDD